MRVAVTGGTGFIGSKLIERLLERGDSVLMLSRGAPKVEKHPRLQICRCDLLCASRQELARILQGGVDVLYHCAGQIENDRTMRALHVDSTIRLVEAAVGHVGHWVQLSSVGVYGPVRCGLVTEKSMIDPHGEYETTKAESDLLLDAASAVGKIRCTILRPSNVYGAGMPNRSLYALIKMIRRRGFFFIGAPGASANYIHVDNVVDALLMCGTISSAVGKVFNLSDWRYLEDFVAVIARNLGTAPPAIRLPESAIRPLAGWLGRLPGIPLTKARVDALTGRAVYSTEKIERELGYTHRISMEDGLSELIKSIP